MTSIKTFFTNLFSRNQVSPDGAPPKGFAPNEEFESKRTTKLGMVFVVIMVITGIWQGQSLFRSVSSTITPPTQLSSCFSTLVGESGENITVDYDSSSYSSNYLYSNVRYGSYNGYDNYYNGSTPVCTYNDIEKKYNIESLYTSIVPLLTTRGEKSKEKSNIESQLSTLRYSTNSVRDNYNTSLFESIANSPASVYATSSLGVVLRTKEQQMQELETKISSLAGETSSITSQIRAIISQKSADLHHVADEFNSQLKWLELKRFLVSIILLAPLAFFALRKYFRAKNERSEFAIIWSAVALITTILSAQLLLVFAYRILPHHIIEAVVKVFVTLFSQFTFLLVLVQWFALILVPLFFGFLVYKIQKKYYNKEAIMMRALKDNKCPQCSMKIKDSMVFCPSCSYTLRKTCASCKHTSISYARYCEECGIIFQKSEAVSVAVTSVPDAAVKAEVKIETKSKEIKKVVA